MIKTSDYLPEDDIKEAEKAALNKLVTVFTNEMRSKVLSKLEYGYSGWDVYGMRDYLMKKMQENYAKCDWVDVANIAMFLSNIQNPEFIRESEK